MPAVAWQPMFLQRSAEPPSKTIHQPTISGFLTSSSLAVSPDRAQLLTASLPIGRARIALDLGCVHPNRSLSYPASHARLRPNTCIKALNTVGPVHIPQAPAENLRSTSKVGCHQPLTLMTLSSERDPFCKNSPGPLPSCRISFARQALLTRGCEIAPTPGRAPKPGSGTVATT